MDRMSEVLGLVTCGITDKVILVFYISFTDISFLIKL